MSLEATIQENTNAIRELIAAIKTGVPTTAAQVAAVVTEAKTTPCAGHDAETTKADAAKETAAKETTAAATEAAASTQSTAEAVADAAPEKKADKSEASDKSADAPTYQATADAVTKLARTKGREAAVAVLTKFGARKLPDVKPEQFAAVIAACEEAGA
jgi:hypothetical protein